MLRGVGNSEILKDSKTNLTCISSLAKYAINVFKILSEPRFDEKEF